MTKVVGIEAMLHHSIAIKMDEKKQNKTKEGKSFAMVIQMYFQDMISTDLGNIKYSLYLENESALPNYTA